MTKKKRKTPTTQPGRTGGKQRPKRPFRIPDSRTIFAIVSIILTLSIFIGSFTLVPRKDGTFDAIRFGIFLFISPLLVRFGVYLLVGPWYGFVMARKNARLAKLCPGYRPRVSVIVPAYNEEVGIVRTLESLAASDYDNLEVVVINDGSKDGTEKRVLDFIAANEQARTGKTFVYHDKQNGGKGRAINTGIQLSSGEIIVTIDADSIVARFRDPEVMCVSGNITVGNTGNIPGLVQYFEYLFSFYLKKMDSLLNTIYVVGGAAAAYRREVFKSLGLFAEDCITEDIDLSMRIQDAGMKIEFAADAIVYTEGASDFGSLLKQRLRWKRGRIDAYWKFRHLFFSRAPRHNKLFSCVLLPLGLFSEVELLFDLAILTVYMLHAIVTQNPSGILTGIVVLAFVFSLLFTSPFKRDRARAHVPYITVAWLLFYIAITVEFIALIRSLSGFLRKRKLEWQSWERKGVFAEEED
jgi:biofilm PGA synthesis N-glycosyltransferase PgaC